MRNGRKVGHGEAVPLDHEGQAVVAKMSKRVRISGGSGTSNNRRASLRLPSPPVALPISAQGRRRSRPARIVNLPFPTPLVHRAALARRWVDGIGTDLDPKAAQRYTALAPNSSAAFGHTPTAARRPSPIPGGSVPGDSLAGRGMVGRQAGDTALGQDLDGFGLGDRPGCAASNASTRAHRRDQSDRGRSK